MTSVAVTSRSFSNHPLLRAALEKEYDKINFNLTGKTLQDDELVAFLQDYEMAIVGLERLDKTILEKLQNLKVVSRFGVGIDTIDLPTLQRKGIKIACTFGANKRAVSELVVSFMLMLLRHLPEANAMVRNKKWPQIKGRQLTGRTVGIVGFGAIGKDLAELLKAFSCQILIYDIVNHEEHCESQRIRQVTLEELLRDSDLISLHLPYSADTHHIINSERLALLKPNAILINTARGGLVDEESLKKILSENKTMSAAFDVFRSEPPMDHELLNLPNFFATPHLAGNTEEAVLAMGYAAIAGLKNARDVII